MSIRIAILLGVLFISAHPASGAVPRFKAQEIDKTLSIGYGVVLSDINGDSKPDILVVDKDRVIWFENPTWKLHTIIGAKTKLDNVCIAAADLDGDGLPEIALGGNWQKMTEPAALYWLSRGKTLDEEWTLHELPYENPTLHRMRFADLDGDGRPELIVAPLHGMGATAKKNFAEAGPKLGYYKVPKDLAGGKWEFQLIDDTKHVMHNILPIDFYDKKSTGLLTASYEGVFHYARVGDSKWLGSQLGEGNQSDPTKSRGSSEVRVGQIQAKAPAAPFKFIATIEPFHGNQVVAYTPAADPKETLMLRTVIDDQLKSGHALGVADLDGDGTDEIVMGSRDPLAGVAGAPPKKFGLNIYQLGEARDKLKWEKIVLDEGGMACEDLVIGDLNGDGRPDIVAVGRGTKNVKIYWNEGK